MKKLFLVTVQRTEELLVGIEANTPEEAEKEAGRGCGIVLDCLDGWNEVIEVCRCSAKSAEAQQYRKEAALQVQRNQERRTA